MYFSRGKSYLFLFSFLFVSSIRYSRLVSRIYIPYKLNKVYLFLLQFIIYIYIIYVYIYIYIYLCICEICVLSWGLILNTKPTFHSRARAHAPYYGPPALYITHAWGQFTSDSPILSSKMRYIYSTILITVYIKNQCALLNHPFSPTDPQQTCSVTL